MTDYVASLIRTWVPIGVGLLLAWLAKKFEVVLDEDTAAQGTAFATAVLTGLYYAIVRFVEDKKPSFGWLLGLAKRPEYPHPPGA